MEPYTVAPLKGEADAHLQPQALFSPPLTPYRNPKALVNPYNNPL